MIAYDCQNDPDMEIATPHLRVRARVKTCPGLYPFQSSGDSTTPCCITGMFVGEFSLLAKSAAYHDITTYDTVQYPYAGDTSLEKRIYLERNEAE